jgi:hypothetical protein
MVQTYCERVPFEWHPFEFISTLSPSLPSYLTFPFFSFLFSFFTPVFQVFCNRLQTRFLFLRLPACLLFCLTTCLIDE